MVSNIVYLYNLHYTTYGIRLVITQCAYYRYLTYLGFKEQNILYGNKERKNTIQGTHYIL